MKHCALLSLLLALGCMHVHGAPVEQGAMEQGSCEDAQAKFAAGLALTKINQDRKEGYILSLHRLSNVHMKTHAETGVVFYLTMDVVETNCSVLSRKDWKTCEARPTHDTPVYGQCKVAIYTNRPHRVVRLYKYDCAIRPVPSSRVTDICPDCPTPVAMDGAEIQKAVTLSLEKFNKESGLDKRFALLKISRATSGMAMAMYYNVEYAIQETTCSKSAAADNCPLMTCEFTHKGFCKASLFYSPTGDADTSVECEIYEPESADREKKLHTMAAETDHAHSDTATHNHDHDHAHAADHTHTHDHVHDHTKSHGQHDATHIHDANSDHDHTHDHDGSSGHRHAHGHSHDHGHGHDHVHAHHAKAHDHTSDVPNQHHDYKHAGDAHTHEHDHEIALDHDHKHAHLHEHEHHHHHHDHDHDSAGHDHPEGMVRVLASTDQPMTLPSFPDVPAAGPEVGVTLPLKPDPQIPGVMEPFIEAFPTAASAQCVPPAVGETLVEKVFAEDPMFKPAA
ncbi:antihemorrhagic factor cHLP-B-like isoform X1 [Labrus mixtus]|uniref:antihemorrhagic factor cHLP-B-like isoform X1 n=1 Tax=Labrus mixtus TaxID=508554 RepID=UPI0029BFD5D7|nr:antihemorrhagic factor cHLP-B-like isoform X1 [Labrus mixtus]